ncbi:MAG: hypothetical protein P4M07_18940 [Xanthobacteraceae bacterium]|nr:hypothetical protein [Xanthobacteraceae bacterium]
MGVVFDAIFSVSVFLLVSIGLFVILGLMNIVNLAHTAFMAVAVYAELYFTGHGWNFWLSAAAGVAVTTLLGAIVEFAIVRRLYGRHIDDTILATWGVSLILVQVLAIAFGSTTTSVAPPLSGSVKFLGELLSIYRIFIVATVATVVAAMAAVIRFSKAGLIVRMVMTNEPLARGVGINTGMVQRLTFVAGAAFAGLAGTLLGPTQGISPSFASSLLASTFLIVLMSGRRLSGLLFACVAAGLAQTLFSAYGNPVIANVMVICTAVVVLRLKPEGLIWPRH